MRVADISACLRRACWTLSRALRTFNAARCFLSERACCFRAVACACTSVSGFLFVISAMRISQSPFVAKRLYITAKYYIFQSVFFRKSHTLSQSLSQRIIASAIHRSASATIFCPFSATATIGLRTRALPVRFRRIAQVVSDPGLAKRLFDLRQRR